MVRDKWQDMAGCRHHNMISSRACTSMHAVCQGQYQIVFGPEKGFAQQKDVLFCMWCEVFHCVLILTEHTAPVYLLKLNELLWSRSAMVGPQLVSIARPLSD